MSAGTTNVKMLRGLGDMEYIQSDLGNHRFPLHFHDTFVIEQVLSGIDWCSNERTSASAGEVYVHFPFAAHTGGTLNQKRLIYRAIYPDQKLFCRLTGMDLGALPIGQTLVSRNGALSQALDVLFRRCDQGEGEASADELALSNVFELVLAEHQASESESSNASSGYQKVLAARKYLLENFQRDVTTSELADFCDMSPYHLIRSFRRHFGITPRQFLISHRVSLAKKKIRSGASVAAAAYSTGFADQSHLARCFKKITSYSPRQLKLA